MPYSFYPGACKAVLEPTNYSPSKGRESQSVDMAPVYLGHEHGLVNRSGSACGNLCGEGDGNCGSSGGGRGTECGGGGGGCGGGGSGGGGAGSGCGSCGGESGGWVSPSLILVVRR